MGEKKYYWLKLQNDFFSHKEIKKLRKIAGGDTYTVIYLKMLLVSLKNDGCLFYDGVEETFAEELADVAIFLLGIAEMKGIDLQKEIEKKEKINESRECVTNELGHRVHKT